LAAGAGQLLHQHRASAAAIPVAGAAALVLAAAGHAVIAGAGRTRAMARRRAAGDGEFGAAAVVHPQAVAALAPGAAFHAGGLRQLPHQHRAAVDGAGPALVVLALAAHQFAGAAAVPAAAAFGEASTPAIVDPHGAAAAAEIAAFDAARAGDVLHQHRAAVERGAAFAPATLVAGADHGGAGPAGAVPAAVALAAQGAGDVRAHLAHAPAALDLLQVEGQLVVRDGAPAQLRGVLALDQLDPLRRRQRTQVLDRTARCGGQAGGQAQA